ncbi:MAG: methyltransferase domain-containing protein [Pseudomonadales bacterium]|nr:methyltransferase domain-containing protein [Pseudomonadales bacterium]
MPQKPVESVPDERWLENHAGLIAEAMAGSDAWALELGCGRGRDSGYLNRFGNLVAVDKHRPSLQKLRNQFPIISTVEMDIARHWPFRTASFDFVLASLSLHYFDDRTTQRCVDELRRCVLPTGYAIVRLNSVNDRNYGAGGGSAIEPYLYQVGDKTKRFFSEETIRQYFAKWQIDSLLELDIDRYKKNKVIWELVCRPRA